MRLTPDPNLARVELAVDSHRKWSVLIPETIACRELCLMHCHNRPPQWVATEQGYTLAQSDNATGMQWRCDLISVDEGVVELKFELRNQSDHPFTDIEADFCFANAYEAWSTRSEAIERSWTNRVFHGQRRERNNDWTLRSMVPTQAGLVIVGDINRHFPVTPHPAVAGKNVADMPIILCQSEDRAETCAAGWDCCNRLYCAMGSCIHTVVWFGTIQPGQSIQRRGRFYYLRADPYQVLAQYQKDFSA